MRIVAFKYGESLFGENYLFRGGRREVMLPISFCFYLIEDGTRRILVDVGCNDGAGFVMSAFTRPAALLRENGIDPMSVSDIILTHHHHDHVEAAADFPGATVHIQRDEYPKAKKHLPDAARVELFDDGLTLTDRVIVRRIGGHTPGSSIVLCTCAGRVYVLCGDECYVEGCLTRGIPTGASHDPAASAAFITEYRKPRYTPLLFHDPAILPGRTGAAVVAEST